MTSIIIWGGLFAIFVGVLWLTWPVTVHDDTDWDV